MTRTTIPLSGKRLEILTYIDACIRDQGFPPSVREITDAVGLRSTSSVHTHLQVLENEGYLRRHPSKPRALEVWWGEGSDSILERRPARHIPLVGDVAAGTDVLAEENIEELVPVPEDFTGDGTLFMLRVRGDSMTDAGIMDGDYVVVNQQDEVASGDIVVAGIPGNEVTVKTFRRRGNNITLLPHSKRHKPMQFKANEIDIYGRVVTVLRKL